MKVNQDSMVYEAERSMYTMGYPTRFTDIVQAQCYLDYMKDSQFVANRWPRIRKRYIEIKFSKRYEWAGSYTDQDHMRLPQWALTDFIIIHEFSHFLPSKKEKEDHGPQFCGALLSLTNHFISPEAAYSLKHSFLAHNVVYEMPVVVR